MAPNFDVEFCSLFCPEDNNSILGFEDYDVFVAAEEEGGGNGPEEDQSHGYSGDFLMEFPLLGDESLGEMVEKECHHMPLDDYKRRLESGVLDLSMRSFAVDWIGKVHAHFNFGPLTAYRSINYLDRFLSSYELPEDKPWMIQLVAIACLSLAAKMEEAKGPRSGHIQVGDGNLRFEARTVQRMELLVLDVLKWRIQSTTPFSMVDYFLHKVNYNKPPSRSAIYRSVEVVLRTTRGTEFLEFRPSEVAAAVAISVTKESETLDFDNAVSHCPLVEKMPVLKCFELIQEMGLISSSRPFEGVVGSVSLVTHSPIGVLDASWSFRTDETIVEICENSQKSPTPAAKRRKFD